VPCDIYFAVPSDGGPVKLTIDEDVGIASAKLRQSDPWVVLTVLGRDVLVNANNVLWLDSPDS
jgi:hypothetical protein